MISETAMSSVQPAVAAAKAAFHCAICGNVATTLALLAPGSKYPLGPPLPDDQATEGWCMWTRGLYTGVRPVDEEVVNAVRAALQWRDSRSLYQLCPDPLCFYCPECEAWYCGDHWRLRAVCGGPYFYDYTVGVCPRLHERALDDD
jgi:hypothetical protein